jgi:hypothetical protein
MPGALVLHISIVEFKYESIVLLVAVIWGVIVYCTH